MLNEAAYRLRALGRLIEALEPMRVGLEMRIKQENWKEAAISAGNLSETELTLGEVTRAVGDAEQSMTYADRSGVAYQRCWRRTTVAVALHQAGRQAEAEKFFREAERMQAEYQPAYPLLYSQRGFRYCDLLLAAPERAVWSPDENGDVKVELLAACRAIAHRTTRSLKIAELGNWLLDMALDHLTLGRAALFEAILADSDFRVASAELDAAVSGLRCAGQVQELPRGLLTRAWLRCSTGPRTGPDSAQADLDEAWEIAARGSMRLHMADIHLYRARLFYREPTYPKEWGSAKADLDAAEKLINECGYHRRDEELADAKAAILGSK